MTETVWSMCGMCTVRCPIRVEVDEGNVRWIEGNPHLLGGALCAKGSAGAALLTDDERPRQPLIRQGNRGAGRWEAVSWETALDYLADRLHDIIAKDGARSVVMSCRGGPFVDPAKAFLHGLGSPNWTNHDSACGSNVHHASRSLYGVGRTDLTYDIKNANHLVLFGRNLLESLKIGEANQVLDLLDAGGRLTYVDIRQTITGLKATRFFQVRPGTDYAFALGLIHGVIAAGAYDHKFIADFTTGFDQLAAFVKPYTVEWAAQECGIKAKHIHALLEELAHDRPRVIFHPGWMLARYSDSFYASRALHVLNVLMGNLEIEGGQILAKGAKDCGATGIRNLIDLVPKPPGERADGAGTRYKHFDTGPGLFHLFYQAMQTGKPYPLKALFCYRHDPFTCFPDPNAQKHALDNLDLIVSIDTHYSEFGWYSDVILPESTYLERDCQIAVQKGAKPRLIYRQKAVAPRHDTKPGWWIFRQLAERMGIDRYFPYTSIEEFWAWQLEPTGLTISDFSAKGFVDLVDQPVLFARDRLAAAIKTPSGTIEFTSQTLEDNGIASFQPYQSPLKPPEGKYRLLFGRSAVHAHGHTINNPLLHELLPANTLWINKREAAKLGIADGDWVDVLAEGANGLIQAKVTEFIHPEAVYCLHGFGRQVPLQSRAYHAGMSDQKLQVGLLENMDPAGGGLCLCEGFVAVRRSSRSCQGSVEL